MEYYVPMSNFNNIALQLWTVRDAMEKDLIGTFSTLKEHGYNYIESANFLDKSSAEFASCAHECGLSIISAHIPYQQLAEEPNKAIEDIKNLGCSYAVLPWLDEEQRQDQWDKVAQVLNQTGAKMRDAGIQLLYHNHDFEFISNDPKTPYQYLLENTDPEVVGFEVDLGWVHYAGVDTQMLLEKYGHRIPIVHMKDIKAIDNSPKFVPLGQGDTPFKALLPILENLDIDWFITEQDECEGDAVKDAISNLTAYQALLAGAPTI